MELLYQLQLLREHGPSILNTFFLLISEGSLICAPLLAASVYWSVSKEKGEKIILAFAFSNFLNNLLKIICCIYRPWIRDPRLHVAEEAAGTATGYSFPSAHSAMAASVFIGTALAFRKEKKRLIPAVLLTLLVMASRMFLGCHTPEDVCAGMAIGLFSLLAAWKLADRIRKEKKRELLFCAGTLLLTAVSLLYASRKSYPLEFDTAGKLLVDPAVMKQDFFGAAGFLCGAVSGFFLEHRFVRFELPSGKRQCVLRCIAGILLLLLIHFAVMKAATASLLPSAAKFLRYYVLLLTAVFFYPLILRAARGRL